MLGLHRHSETPQGPRRKTRVSLRIISVKNQMRTGKAGVIIVVSSEITNASRAKQPKIHHSCFRGLHVAGSFCSTLSIAVSLFISVAGDLSHKNREHSSRGSRSEGNDKCFLDLIMLSVKRLCLLLRYRRFNSSSWN